MVKIKRISLGTTDFKEIIEKDLYYIDKTLIINEDITMSEISIDKDNIWKCAR